MHADRGAGQREAGTKGGSDDGSERVAEIGELLGPEAAIVGPEGNFFWIFGFCLFHSVYAT
jgi:hypothetical protein